MRIVDKKIEVIAQHNKAGEVRPVKLRINEGGELKTFSIKVKVKDETTVEKERVLIYGCDISVDGCVKPCEIRFYTQRLFWSLFRI